MQLFNSNSRVARIFKASQQLSGLQIIFDTFINAMPQLFSIMTLILLILYIFAILGMNLFGTVVRHGPRTLALARKRGGGATC